jgi:hypothetical protein
MAEPKLLTEVEAQVLFGWTAFADFLAELRERGLIAEEPVDPLLVEAEALVQRWCGQEGAEIEDLALAALRRGIEIGEANRKELTREMVLAAALVASPYGCITDRYVNELHAALQEQLK